ncbi:hypothetical protein [Sulfurisphaera javensis]|uniref:hypothetical protein n=1 Tax=Sulfurisphaera javensis TaxID=2049879 RepID=UPI0034E86A3F
MVRVLLPRIGVEMLRKLLISLQNYDIRIYTIQIHSKLLEAITFNVSQYFS